MADSDSGNCRCRLLIDTVIIVVLLIPIVICEIVIQPKRRGFFCNDEMLQYPFQPPTISGSIMCIIILLIPLLLIVMMESSHFYQKAKCGKKLQYSLKWRIFSLLRQSSKEFAFYVVGLILTFDVSDLAKLTIGHLRPHFMAVCQPQLPDGRTCSDVTLQGRFIDDYECVANGFTARDVRQILISFPSLHSAFCFYAMLYMTFYLQNRFNWSGSILTRVFLQFSLMMLAWFTSLSRIMDYWHHWSDVIAGSLIGVTIAMINAFFIAKLFAVPRSFNSGKRMRKEEQEQLKQTDPCLQQETMTTLPSCKQ